MITKEEKQFIKANNALPKSLIDKKVSQLKDQLVYSDKEDFIHSQKFVRELENWINTIFVFQSEPKKKEKKFEV